MKSTRLGQLPLEIRRQIKQARLDRGWSQLELGRRVGLPQVHISAIENGKTVPRFDTLLDLVRVLDYDLLLVPRTLVPAVHALTRDHRDPTGESVETGERPLYADLTDEDEGTNER